MTRPLANRYEPHQSRANEMTTKTHTVITNRTIEITDLN